MSINVRVVKPDDLSSLLVLLYQLSGKKAEDSDLSGSAASALLSKILSDENYHLAVYERDGALLGTATLLVQLNLSHGGRPYGHIENVVTDKDHRGEGIGRELIDYLLNEAKKRNCYKVILDCSKENTPFYEKCGFSSRGEVEMRIDIE